MDYGQFKAPPPPKSGSASGGRLVTGRLRAVSYLWKTTVPGNEFGTDGDEPKVPEKWAGDDLRACRQWHGVDLSAKFSAGKPDPASIRLRELSYSGMTETCGLVGKTTSTDRHVTEPKIDQEKDGTYYVEVKTLLGTRLGAFVPDLNRIIEQLDSTELLAGAVLSYAQDRYLGNDRRTPKIFTYARLRISANKITGGWVSSNRGNGFLTQEEIITQQIGTSWIPEHHLYLGANQNKETLMPALSQIPVSPKNLKELEQWVDMPWQPFDVEAFEIMTAALKKWANSPLKVKQKAAADFKKRYPDYFITTLFPDH